MTSLTLDLTSDDTIAKRLGGVLTRLVAFVGTVTADAPPGEWTVTLLLTSDDDISLLHGTYFGDPSSTDVITFPFVDDDPESKNPVIASMEGPMIHHLGDIVISVDTAAANAAEIGHPADREIAFLTLHGLLHLFGYDDETPLRRAAMLARQDELLEQFERREPTPWS